MDTQDFEPDLDNFLKKSFLDLEKIDDNIYRSTYLWHPTYSQSVYGGQIIGQALVAAAKTVPPSQSAHSLHCYFLQRGNGERPILYHVDRTRDGKTYCSRSVKAVQYGKSVMTMQASFKREENDPFAHQYKMPNVIKPEDLLNTEELIKLALQRDDLSEKTRVLLGKLLDEQIPMEVRPVQPEHLLRQNSSTPTRQIWIKANGHIGNDIDMHKCAAAYMSDSFLLDVSAMTADKTTAFSMTSLDHSIWFHNPFQANDWLLYEMESPFCGDGRALAMGRLWRRDGVLAMSVSQEGVIRTLTNSKL